MNSFKFNWHQIPQLHKDLRTIQLIQHGKHSFWIMTLRSTSHTGNLLQSIIAQKLIIIHCNKTENNTKVSCTHSHQNNPAKWDLLWFQALHCWTTNITGQH